VISRFFVSALLAVLSCAALAQPVVPGGGSGAAGRAALSMMPDTGVAPRRSTLTIGFASNVLSNGLSASSNNTYLYAVPYPAEATAIRVLVPLITAANGATMGPITVRPSTTFLTASIGPSSGASCDGTAAGDNYTFTCDTGVVQGGSGFQYITWAEKGTLSERQHRWGSDTSITTVVYPNLVSPDPETGATNHSRIMASDWAPLSSLPRSDVAATSPRVAMVRAFVPTGNTVTRCAGTPNDTSITGISWTGQSSLNSGYDFSVRTVVNDNTVAGSISTSAATSGDVGPICWFQFRLLNKGVQITTIGDSWTRGDTTSSHLSNFVMRSATALSTAALPIVHAGGGWSAAATTTYKGVGVDLINATQPSICVLQPYTANDTPTTINIANITLANVMSTAEQCIRLGAKVILVSPFPRNTLSGGTLTTWQAIYAKVIAISDANIFVFDATRILGAFSGAVPTGQYLNGTISTDGIHPNDAGTVTLMTGANGYPGFQAMLKYIIGMN
jgi:hypothetical protein